MSLLSEYLNQIKKPSQTEQEEFIDHLKHWIPVAIIIGIVVGAVMGLFIVFIFLIHQSLSSLPGIVGIIIGSGIIIFLIKIKYEKVENNGINFVISQKHKQAHIPLHEAKEFLSSGIALGSGLPVGKEGPAMVIGSAIASKIASVFGIKKEELHDAITVGSAAATGALFQAPLGAAVFASEVPYKQDSDEPVLMISFVASVLAALTMRTMITEINNRFFQIDLNLFHIGGAAIEITWKRTLESVLLGIIIGFVGFLFINLYYSYKSKVLAKFEPFKQVLIGIGIMLIFLAIGSLIDPDLYLLRGVSSFQGIEDFITLASIDIVGILLLAVFLQIVTTTAIIGTGFPGGIFGPSLTVGALLGISFAVVLGESDRLIITAFAIIGMSASHSATTKTPIASVLLILEITGLPNLVIPIVLANIAAYITSGTKSLYDSQIHSRDSQIIKQLSQYDQLEEFTVSQIMTTRAYLVYTTPDEMIVNLNLQLERANKRTIPVLDGEDLVGIITPRDIDDALFGENLIQPTLVSEAMSKNVVTVNDTMTGREAMFVFIEKDMERCPVLNKDDEVVGIVSIKDILRGHSKITEMKRSYFD